MERGYKVRSTDFLPHNLPKGKDPSAGFSLLELIISLFLITLILGLLYGVLNMASNITKEGINVGRFEDHLRIFYTLLEKDLISSYPKEFHGEKSSLEFFTTHLSRYGRRRVKYLFTGGKVIYTSSEYLFDKKIEEVLIEGLRGIRFSYLYNLEDNKWRESWSSEKEKRLPYMVKIYVNNDKEGLIIPILSVWKSPSFKEEK